MKKRILSLMLILCIFGGITGYMPVGAVAEEPAVFNGTCGENLMWDYNDGKLIISGTGKMTDWYDIDVPWSSFVDDITAVQIDSGVASIGSYAFSNCQSLESITIPGSVSEIGEGAFEWCENLKSVTLEYGVKRIGEYSFSSSGITDITIPVSVNEIGGYAFSNCRSLSDVTIQSGVKNIGGHAFERCRSLENITVPGSVAEIGEYSFSKCYNLTNVTIRNGVEKIGNSAFSSCGQLIKITIPGSVNVIGEGIIYGSGYVQVDLDSSNPYYCMIDGVLYNSEKTNLILYTFTEEKEYKIPDGVTDIFAGAFGCSYNLNVVTIPESVIRIGSNALNGSFESIEVAEKNPNYCSIDGNLYSKDKTTLIRYASQKSDTSFEIPLGVKIIGTSAFEDCKNLLNIIIPESAKQIDDFAFWGCDGLKRITIPGNVVEIGENAFEVCVNLESVTIKSGVEKLNDYAFSDCDKLASVSIPESINYVGKDIFGSYSSLGKIYYRGTEDQWYDIFESDYGAEIMFGCKALSGIISECKYENSTVTADVKFDYSFTDNMVLMIVYDNRKNIISVAGKLAAAGDEGVSLSCETDKSRTLGNAKILFWDTENKIKPLSKPIETEINVSE